MIYSQFGSNIEVWRPVVGYEGYYEVSNLGNVRSMDRMVSMNASGKMRNRIGKDCALWYNFRGYKLVTLYKNAVKTGHPVHRLVAASFIPNPDNKKEVNHKNGVKDDNNLDNLEWMTRLENQRHAINTLGWSYSCDIHHNSKVTNDQVLEMRELYKTGKYTKSEIGRMFNVHKDIAIRIINRHTYKNI